MSEVIPQKPGESPAGQRVGCSQLLDRSKIESPSRGKHDFGRQSEAESRAGAIKLAAAVVSGPESGLRQRLQLTRAAKRPSAGEPESEDVLFVRCRHRRVVTSRAIKVPGICGDAPRAHRRR